MKASAITIFLCSVIFLNCNSDNRVTTLEKELKTKDSLLAQNQGGPAGYVIAFKKTTGLASDMVKLNIVYTYNDGTGIQEIITFNNNNKEYYYHTILTDCSKKLSASQITFYAIQNPMDEGASRYTLIPPDNKPHIIPIEQDPRSGPSQLTFTIRNNQIDPCSGSEGPGKQTKKDAQFTAVYTVEIN